MRLSRFIIPLLFATIATAAETKPSPVRETTANPNPREAALDLLLSERTSEEAFAAAIATARKQGISEQAVLEARFIFHVDRREDQALVALLPDFLARNETFAVGDSEIFATKEDWLAVIEYLKAITALRAGDKDGFKKHITEAFWLSPSQGSAFAHHIDQLRLAEVMASTKIDFESAFTPLAGGDPVTLGKILTDQKALLLQFWSPSSSACEASLTDFTAIAGELAKNQIAIATIVLETSPESLTEARTLIKPIAAKPSGVWLIEREKDPLRSSLRVQSVPAFVLVSPSGSILFNGSSDADDLWTALGKINPAIVRPELAAPAHDD